MKTLLIESVRWVNLPYTALIGAMGMYWITVILGLLDIEIFDFEIDVDVDAEFGVGSVFEVLNVGSVPFSIWLTIFAFQMWLYSLIYNLLLDEITRSNLSGLLRFVTCAIICIPIAAVVTKLATNPLNKIFEVKTVRKNEFVNQECIVTSSQVDEEFGTGEIRIGGVPQLIDIRARPTDGTLKRDDKALIYEYDKERDVFYVTAM
jgi:hypothetical protein